MGRRILRPCRRVEAGVVPVGQQLLLDPGNRPAWDRGGLVEAVRLVTGERQGAVGGPDPDRANAIAAEAEEEPEVVLVGRPAGPRLAAAKPALRAEMLEEGMEAVSPVMIADVGRKGAGDILRPSLAIDEARVGALLAELASGLSLEGDNGGAVRDRRAP